MQTFLIIFLQELKLNFRHFERILANFLFFAIFLSIFFLLSQTQQNQGLNDVIFIWFALLAALIFSSSEFLKKDFEDGSLEQISLAVENLEVAIFAKMLANWVICCGAILPLIFLLKLDLELLTVVLLGSLVINFLCCLCGSLSMLGNAAPAISVIILPLIIPTLLLAQGEFAMSVKLLLALVVFSGTTAVFATTRIVKIAGE
jgi:heme exporter protein B